jgi:predicted nuclease with RNAse H fold
VDRSRFQTFVGVDLGGGKGKNTAVALLRAREGGVTVERYDTGGGQPWYDDKLVPFLLGLTDAVVAIDAPLSLTACVRCRVPVCPGLDACVDPTTAWFRERANGAAQPGKKPRYTPYTQRATEVVMHEQHGILPRETLGQGMGPITARAAHLARALAPSYRLNQNLIEVYPKATVWKLLGEETARAYKRWGTVRLGTVLAGLPEIAFGPSQWRQKVEWNDHLFDAVICAYTGYLWARDGWQLPTENRAVFEADGWIWSPP